jgi:hypothetical protein
MYKRSGIFISGPWSVSVTGVCVCVCVCVRACVSVWRCVNVDRSKIRNGLHPRDDVYMCFSAVIFLLS